MSRRIERAAIVAEELASLYPNPPVPLDHKDAYTLLIAVLLSAQCTDARVNQVTPELFELADNAEKMQLQSVETVRKIIRPCGLSPTKSKNIVALSRQLVEQFHGEVPQDFALLESCQVSGTRRHPWSWHRLLVIQPSPWIRIFIA